MGRCRTKRRAAKLSQWQEGQPSQRVPDVLRQRHHEFAAKIDVGFDERRELVELVGVVRYAEHVGQIVAIPVFRSLGLGLECFVAFLECCARVGTCKGESRNDPVGLQDSNWDILSRLQYR